MEARLKEQVEAMRVELLSNFKFAFTQLRSYSEVMVPDLEIIQDVKEEIVVSILYNFTLNLLLNSILQITCFLFILM